ncbi:MAG: hypothetical protein GWP04_03305 [Gammaproteobacteria bacterium]|nr:hypothetical protein [Gammaproteobacteria bacterium]
MRRPRNLRRVLSLVAIGVVAVAGVFIAQRSGNDHAPVTATSVIDNSEFAGCTECHDDLDAALLAGQIPTLDFTHSQHEKDAGAVACGSCHPAETHVGRMTFRPTMENCFGCHGASADNPIPCAACHPLSVVPKPPSHAATDWGTAHGIGVLNTETSCTTCHSASTFCEACHGVEMPHPEDWAGKIHALAFFDGGSEVCKRCHSYGMDVAGRDECDTCHHTAGPQDQSWVNAHQDVVGHEGGGSCFACHEPATCVQCHLHGIENLDADRARLLESDE